MRAPSGTAVADCLVMVVGAVLGFAVWLYAPPHGYRRAFEGEGPREPYYVDLPLLVCGLPLLALCLWLVARAAVVRARLGRWAPALPPANQPSGPPAADTSAARPSVVCPPWRVRGPAPAVRRPWR